MLTREELALVGIDVDRLIAPGPPIRFFAGDMGASLLLPTPNGQVTVEFSKDSISFGRLLFHQLTAFVAAARSE